MKTLNLKKNTGLQNLRLVRVTYTDQSGGKVIFEGRFHGFGIVNLGMNGQETGAIVEKQDGTITVYSLRLISFIKEKN